MVYRPRMKRISKLAEVVFFAANIPLDVDARVAYNFAQEPTDVPDSGLGGWTFTVTVSSGGTGEQRLMSWTGQGSDPEAAFTSVYKQITGDMNRQKYEAMARIRAIEDVQTQLESDEKLLSIWPKTDAASAENAVAAEAYLQSSEGQAHKVARGSTQQDLAEDLERRRAQSGDNSSPV